MSGGNDEFITPGVLIFQTILDADQELLSEPERPHPQRVDRDFEAVSQSLPVFDLRAFLALIVLNDQLAVIGGEAFEAAPQAFDARLQLFKFVYGSFLARQLAEGAALFDLLLVNFEQQQPRDPDGILDRITNRFPLADLACDSIDRLVSVIFRERAAAPLEEANQVTPNLQIFFARAFPVRAEISQ